MKKKKELRSAKKLMQDKANFLRSATSVSLLQVQKIKKLKNTFDRALTLRPQSAYTVKPF